MLFQSFVLHLFGAALYFSYLIVSKSIDEPEVLQYFTNIQHQNPSDPRLVHHFYDNGTVIPSIIDVTLSSCNQHCGRQWNLFPLLDTQKRITTWHIPLFILVGSMYFASFGIWNTLSVSVHLLGDPISTFESLLSKLRSLQKHRQRCAQELKFFSPNLQKAVAMILAACDEWDYDAILCTEQKESFSEETIQSMETQIEVFESSILEHDSEWKGHSQDMFETLKTWLGGSDQPPEMKHLYRRTACLIAANELSDCRSSSLPKTIIGVVSYITSISSGFVYLNIGEYTNRTGHSIAMSMLYSWLIPTVLLCALVGGYITKRSAEDVLERLHQRFKAIEEDAFSRCGETKATLPLISRFCADELYGKSFTYKSLEWSGGNYTFRPRQSRWGKRTLFISAISHLPVICAFLCAVFISYTSPTRGLGCRSVQQMMFGFTWITSAFITQQIRVRVKSAYHQWLYIRIKDTIIFIAQALTFWIMIIGWFNSCFCWSAWFSLFGKAHVMITTLPNMKTLAQTKWLPLVLASILGQLSFLLCIWIYFRKAVHLFDLSDKDRHLGRWEMPQRGGTIAGDKKSSYEMGPMV